MLNALYVTMEIMRMKTLLCFVVTVIYLFIRVAMVLSNYLRVTGFVTTVTFLA